MKEAIIDVMGFIKQDILPNLPYYLLQVFLFVLLVIIFAFINIIVRLVTDPLCYKVLRMKEENRGPGMVAFVVSLVVAAFMLVVAYNAFPQLQPTVVGWTGHKVQQILTWDWEETFEAVPEKIKKVLPKDDDKKAETKTEPAKKTETKTPPPKKPDGN